VSAPPRTRLVACIALALLALLAPLVQLTSGAATSAAGADAGGAQAELSAVLIALAVVIGAARLVGRAFARLGQPAVLGEILAGILLGPSFLGRLAPGLAARVLPASAIPALEIVAQAGVILYLFLVGLGLEGADVRARRATVTAVSFASLALPFALGLCVAPLLHPQLASETVPFGVFALFVGVSLSVTAFPVLARILEDEGLTTTPLGRLALAIAAVGDVAAWCLLALVTAFARARTDAALETLGLTAAYLAAMRFVVRPLAGLFARRCEPVGLTRGTLVVVTLALLTSALCTEAIGIHALFGAFLLGALVPRGSRLARELRARFEDLVLVVLLPAFFAITGLRTEIGLVQGAADWLACGLIVAAASVGKIGGAYVGARVTGLGPRESASLGVLLNTRGLMELIVLGVGLELGVLSPRLYTMMVIMALVTTFATAPLLRVLRREHA
jgi:Kef-type K+ transport system membrane component KefB